MIQDRALDAQALAATLAQYDVRFLRTGNKAPSLNLDPEELIAALSLHSEPRLHEALIPLFLSHPHFSEVVPDLVNTLPESASNRLRHLYTAAVYLQRLWQGKLEIYLGEKSLLPDYFGESELGLPSPTEHYGEAGLRVLADRLYSETGISWFSAYESIMSNYFYQLGFDLND